MPRDVSARRGYRAIQSTLAQLMLLIREDSAGDQPTFICILYELDEHLADNSVLI